VTVRIETTDKVKVGDHVDHNGKKYTVAEAVVWSDALDNYAYTEAVLKLARGDAGEA
jgi:hypothetical protein